jgi:uncharacterized protein (PEP-CTERM system associated)
MVHLGPGPAKKLLVVALLAGAAAPAAFAQRWTLEPGASSQLTWTNNSLLGATGARDDLVLELRPRISLRGEGARLRLAGTAALNAITYFNGTRASRALPEADLNARLEAIERWLFLEAGVKASQSSSDPFGVRFESGTTANTLTTTQGRFSPSIEAPIDALTRYRIRSDNTWTHLSSADSTATAATGAAGYFGRHAATIEHDPAPLGWRVEAERNQTRYRDGVTTPLITEVARAVVDYAATQELALGLRGGYERSSSVVAAGGRGTIYGAQVKWQPSVRTLLSAENERRFFGSAWRLGFDHRSPHLAFNLALSRGLQTTPQSLFELPATGNVEALLDAMFTTRIPDRAERDRVVQKLIADQRLPSATLVPTSISSQRQSLVTARSGSVGVLGSRNAVFVGFFDTRTEDVPDAAALATGVAANNNQQRGASLTYSHRVAAAVSLSATLDWSRIRALNLAAPTETTQYGARAQVSVAASPRSSVVFGGRLRKVDSNIAVSGQELAIFAGLDHRF